MPTANKDHFQKAVILLILDSEFRNAFTETGEKVKEMIKNDSSLIDPGLRKPVIKKMFPNENPDEVDPLIGFGLWLDDIDIKNLLDLRKEIKDQEKQLKHVNEKVKEKFNSTVSSTVVIRS